MYNLFYIGIDKCVFTEMGQHMNINYFKEFVILADTKNYLEASEILYISQSSLSKHIKSMENELGVMLFERTSRSVELTKIGELFLPYAKSIMNSQLEYTDMIRDELDDFRGQVTIGSIPAIAQYGITDLLVEFKKQFPQYMVKIFEQDNQKLIESLRQKQCDLIFVRDYDYLLNKEEFEIIPYLVDPMVALLPKNHPLASSETIRLEQLREEPFIMLEEDEFLQNLWERCCHHVGFKPRVSFSCHRLDGILDLVTKNMGVSIVMQNQVSHPADSKLPAKPPWATCKLIPEVNVTVYLCYRKSKPLSKAARHFVECVKEHAVIEN